MSHVTGEALPFSFYGVHRICYILTVGLAMTGTILLDSVRYRKYSARSSIFCISESKYFLLFTGDL